MRATRKHLTTGRIFSILAVVGLVTGMSAAGPGAAAAGRTVTLQVRPVIVADATDCGVFGVDLELWSLQGVLVGTAHACADDPVSESDHPGTWRLVFTGSMSVTLPGGTISGPVLWDRQVWVPDAANPAVAPELVERFRVDVTGGTGDYANVTGSIGGGGIVQWDGDVPVDETLWTITLRLS
jgi:hypothetical protein